MGAKTQRRYRKRKREDDDDKPYLPDEVIFENIITRVPSSTLMRCSNVCKLWYNSILDDQHFATAYLAQQSKKDPPFIFYNLNVLKDEDDKSSKFPYLGYIFRFEDDDHKRKTRVKVDHLLSDEKYLLKKEYSRIELVGNCDGLVCFSRISGSILIVNPSRQERLVVFYPIVHGAPYTVCCYGFGFDSLTHEYKVVLIVRTTTASTNNELKCLVFTLGTNSWRETSSTTIPMPTTSFYKSAIFCSGALFWRTKSSSGNDMSLLSLDLHNYEFQVIRLPAECGASSSLLEQHHQIIDPLLEFKGSPCVARLEKTKLQGGGNCTHTSTSYCYKVHLHILKGYSKVGRPNEQVWIKETFDVPPLPLTCTAHLSPAAPCFLRTGIPTTYRAPPNRIMSLSDGRVFLYCFSGQVIETYDLQTKRLKIAHFHKYAKLFSKKKHSEVYDQIDYHLRGGHIENFMSMLAFIPKGGEGAPPRLDRRGFISFLGDEKRIQLLLGYLTVPHHKSADIYLL